MRTLPGHEYATYYGATAMLHLEVFPGQTPGLYRCAVYDWFDRKPLYVSGTDRPLDEARSEAEQEAARLVGYTGDTEWRPERDA